MNQLKSIEVSEFPCTFDLKEGFQEAFNELSQNYTGASSSWIIVFIHSVQIMEEDIQKLIHVQDMRHLNSEKVVNLILITVDLETKEDVQKVKKLGEMVKHKFNSVIIFNDP